MSRPVYTAKMLSDMARQTADAKLVTLWSMADGSVATINYKDNLYEVRVTQSEYGTEKWSHPKTKRRDAEWCARIDDDLSRLVPEIFTAPATEVTEEER